MNSAVQHYSDDMHWTVVPFDRAFECMLRRWCELKVEFLPGQQSVALVCWTSWGADLSTRIRTAHAHKCADCAPELQYSYSIGGNW